MTTVQQSRRQPPALTALIATLCPDVPPSLMHLIQSLWNSEGYHRFQQMLDELMPEAAQHILRQPGYEATIRAFQTEFESRYLPLEPGLISMIAEEGPVDDDPWHFLNCGVPLELHGFLIDDLHELAGDIAADNIAPGLALMTLLFPVECLGWETNPLIRLPWLEAAAAIVPAAVLNRIPINGFEPRHIDETFQDAGLTDLRNLAQWMQQSTPYPLLNCQYDPEVFEMTDLPWEQDAVLEVSRQWRDAQPLLASITRGQRWLESDPAPRMDYIISLLLNDPYPWASVRTE